jgi:BolA protein
VYEREGIDRKDKREAIVDHYIAGSKMSVKDQIIAKLEDALAPQSLEVIDESHKHAGHSGSRPGGETHFRVKLTAAAFSGQSRVDRHRTINGLLAEELKGGVHALAIEAKTPEEASVAQP